MNKWDVFTLQKFGVYEQLQGEEENHQDDARHQDTVEAWAEETELPQGHLTTTARLQPVGPTEKKKTCLLFMIIDTAEIINWWPAGHIWPTKRSNPVWDWIQKLWGN